MLDADKLLAYELDGDLFLGNETVGCHHQCSYKHAAKEQQLRTGSQTFLDFGLVCGVDELRLRSGALKTSGPSHRQDPAA